MQQLLIGLSISIVVAIYAYKKGSLSTSGFIGATIYGGALYYFGGILFLGIMLSFFISSSILSKYRIKDKEFLAKIHEKGDTRDYTQVIANGLPSFVFAWLYYLTANPGFMLGFASSLAAANADTWASELGVLSQKKPVSIISGKPTEKGMSGGITPFGTCASLFGGIFIALLLVLGGFLGNLPKDQIPMVFILCSLAGIMGSLIDSILGATLQGIYFDNVTGRFTEKRFSEIGENKLIKGFKWVTNGLVNLLSGAIASIVVVMIYMFIK